MEEKSALQTQTNKLTNILLSNADHEGTFFVGRDVPSIDGMGSSDVIKSYHQVRCFSYLRCSARVLTLLPKLS